MANARPATSAAIVKQQVDSAMIYVSLIEDIFLRFRYVASNSLLVVFITVVLYANLASSPSAISSSPQVVPPGITTAESSTAYQPTVIVMVEQTTTTTTATTTATSTATVSTTLVSKIVETVSAMRSTTEFLTTTTTSAVGIVAGMSPNMNTLILIASIVGGMVIGAAACWAFQKGYAAMRKNSGHATEKVERKSISIVVCDKCGGTLPTHNPGCPDSERNGRVLLQQG